jgi:putative acyl-CoA dehydrogenase
MGQMTNRFSTHEVTNQPPPFEDVNLFTADAVLTDTVAREGGGGAAKSLVAFGLTAGSREAFELGRRANEQLPHLRTHDRQGRRIDMVDYDPAYHELMETSFGQGLHSSVWSHLGASGGSARATANVERAAVLYMAAQMEAGHCCPLTMTNASVPVLLAAPDLAQEWLPKILSKTYDPRFLPMADKSSVTLGMGMTEKQGGTDLRANTASAVRDTNGHYRLTGHKWFLSAPMSDAFLILAQAPGGLSCFLLPRFRPDGRVNALHFQRLKDKLGNRSNASSEVEFQDADVVLIGEEGRGVASIIDMVTHTRLDCAVSSAGLMRLALAHAIHHAEHRLVGGKPLASQPLMQQVLADLALDVEAATALSFRLARAFDRATDARAAAWRRLMTPVTKYWVCKIAPALVAEAMECLGGNGYVEEQPLARLYREVPVNAIWEGSGNVMALDVLRVLQKEPDVAELVMQELGTAAAGDPHLTAAHARAQAIFHEPRLLDARARTLVEGLALLAAGTILRAHAPPAVADAFIATRLGQLPRQTYGQALDWADTKAILARATPNR